MEVRFFNANIEEKFGKKTEEYMILVLLGTQHNEFKRLLEKIEECIDRGFIKEEVVVQAGFTKFHSDKMKIFDMISKEILENLVDDANVVITHGGAGSIIMALNKHKKVIAVPRLHEFNEHVNNHQRQIVNVFNEKEYLIGIQNVEDLPEALNEIKNFIPKKYKSENQKIIKLIEDFIEKV